MKNKTIKTLYKGTEVELKFKIPSKLIYSNVISEMQKGDQFEALYLLVLNSQIKDEVNNIDLSTDDALRASLTGELFKLLLDFPKPDVSTTYIGKKHKKLYNELLIKYPFVFVVTVDKDVFFLKPITRVDHKEIFNATIKSQLTAFDYVYNNLMLGGDDINNKVLSYVSCFAISEYLITFKEYEIKKK